MRETSAALLVGLRKQGFSLRVVDGKLIVAPISKLTPVQLSALKSQRADLVALLEWEASEPASDTAIRSWLRRADSPEVAELEETMLAVKVYRDWLVNTVLPPGPVVVAVWLVIVDLRHWQASQRRAMDQWLEEPKTTELASRCRYGRVLVEQVERVKAVLDDKPV